MDWRSDTETRIAMQRKSLIRRSVYSAVIWTWFWEKRLFKWPTWTVECMYDWPIRQQNVGYWKQKREILKLLTCGHGEEWKGLDIYFNWRKRINNRIGSYWGWENSSWGRKLKITYVDKNKDYKRTKDGPIQKASTFHWQGGVVTST